jgi:hypothetical protein
MCVHDSTEPSLQTEFNNSDLCEIRALVDRLGHRVVSTPCLPLSRIHTLKIGYHDTLRKFICDPASDPAVASLEKTISLWGEEHAIMPYHFGADKTRVPISFDFEAHICTSTFSFARLRSLTFWSHPVGGKSWVVDCARICPPVYQPTELDMRYASSEPFAFIRLRNSRSRSTKSRFLWELFRPEFLVIWRASDGVPLCCDVYLNQLDPNIAKIALKNALKATDFLLMEQLPSCAAYLATLPPVIRGRDMQLIMHFYGINLRYLLLIRSHMKSLEWRTLIMTEVIARVTKHLCKEKLRLVMVSQFVPEKEMRDLAAITVGQSAAATVVVQHLNYIGSPSAAGLSFWRTVLIPQIQHRFPGPVEDRLDSIDFPVDVICRRFLQLMGIGLSDVGKSKIDSMANPAFSKFPYFGSLSPFSRTML